MTHIPSAEGSSADPYTPLVPIQLVAVGDTLYCITSSYGLYKHVRLIDESSEERGGAPMSREWMPMPVRGLDPDALVLAVQRRYESHGDLSRAITETVHEYHVPMCTVRVILNDYGVWPGDSWEEDSVPPMPWSRRSELIHEVYRKREDSDGTQ